MKRLENVAIVGVGLIGGSIGLAIRQRGLAESVVGIGRRQVSLRIARRVGAVTHTTVDLEKGVAHADLVIICTPVAQIVERVRRAAAACPEGTLITDAGSTKQAIVTAVDGQLPRGCRFLGGHPIAGSEKGGPSYAQADLFEGRVVVLTPTKNTRAEDFDLLEEFWQGMGSVVLQMSPEEHDRALAVTSHLPHMAAAALAVTVTEPCFRLAGPGLLDATRVAAADPALWKQILLMNRENVLTALEQFGSNLSALHTAIRDGDEAELERYLASARRIEMLWEVDIYPADGQPDLLGGQVAASSAELGLADGLAVVAARGYLIQGALDRADIERIAAELLTDRVVERAVVAPAGDAVLRAKPQAADSLLVHVLPKPGVMDPVAQSVLGAIADFGLRAEAVRTLKKYWIAGLPEDRIESLCSKVLANDAIEQAVVGPLTFRRLEVGSPYVFQLATVAIRAMDAAALADLSLRGQLYLSLVEMQTIRDYFEKLGRDPTDVELETVAQTWSEHCSHKTLAGRISYRDGSIERRFENMLRETIFAATEKIRADLGPDDWCVSVFRDNAGVVRFDDQYNVVFKVETHNHPSALEPYGGANTGIGGVIRDPMGTGMGAKPIANTDVFCFAPPDTPAEEIPAGVLHPRRIAKGVVAGVRDYGNRMGIPTVNGAIYFDPRYLGNPLVFCGNVGLIPRDKSSKQPVAGDLVVAMGGRTGRDGIHGATFSSAELTSQSDSVSGGAVQIGNAITEKMLLDVLLAARDRGLYSAVTDCGAGGFSSAVGEMGEKIGAEVHLDRAPVKYEGLSYTEIWISEAQERMVLSVPPEKWDELSALCASEGVEATVIGRFVPTGRLVLKYNDHTVADLAMEFVHDGRPPVVREAVYEPPAAGGGQGTVRQHGRPLNGGSDYGAALLAILGSLNVASKEWVIRQYDHEVQGASVVKPLVGVAGDGPSDAAVLRPVPGSNRGIVLSCGMNPCYGDLDPYWMAASAIDEAVRNCVAVGADPRRTAILDNFCWGNTDRPETLGSLVRAALACYDIATVLGTPFISGKDSLNNEFRPKGAAEPIAIPPSLLISALGQIEDVRRAVTMDLKEPGNLLYQVGVTRNEMGGSHFARVQGQSGGQVPRVDPHQARRIFEAVHGALDAGLVRSCHDPSEGGLAVAAAEMAFAGGCGLRIDLGKVPCDGDLDPAILLFSESNSRFLCEVRPADAGKFEEMLGGVPHARIGELTGQSNLMIVDGAQSVIETDLATLKEAWQKPLRW